MEKLAAKEIMQEILQMTAHLNAIAGIVENVTSEEERKMLRRHIGHMMAACDEHLFRPVLREHPDLEPHH